MSWATNLLAIGSGVAAGIALERRMGRVVRGTRDGAPLEVLEAPEEGDDGFIEGSRGSEIYWHVRGTGSPTFLLVHGICLTGQIWRAQKLALSQTHRVVTIDMAGHGESSLGAGHERMESFADDLRAVIERLDLHDVVLVGHSMGGMATQQFVVQNPVLAAERLRGLVLLSTAPTGRLATAMFSGSRIQDRLADFETRRISPLSVWGAGRVRLDRVMGPSDLGALFTHFTFGADAGATEIEFTRRLVVNTPANTVQASIAAIFGYDVRDRLEEIGIPVLVISGRRDALTPLYMAYETARHVRDARIKVLARRGHMIMFEEPDTLEQLLRDFAHSIAPKPGGVGGRGLAGMIESERRV